ncbi:hypothetical protein KCU59_g128, partial [Aureobasidium melanogenum]
MATEHDVIRVTTKGSNVVMNPLQSLLYVENTKVLRTVLTQLSRVGVSKDAFSGVEADEDDVLASKVVALELYVAAGASDHGTTIHVHKDLILLPVALAGAQTLRFKQSSSWRLYRSLPSARLASVMVLETMRNMPQASRCGRYAICYRRTCSVHQLSRQRECPRKRSFRWHLQNLVQSLG